MYYFIVNPHSGSGRGLRVWQTIERIIARKHIQYEAYLTEGPQDAALYAAEITQVKAAPQNAEEPSNADSDCECRKMLGEDDVIVVVGGDGTFGEVLNGMNTDAPAALGYVPVGMGNDLARSLNLSRSTSWQIRRILRAKKTRCLDYGIVTVDGENGESCHRRFIVS